jgi:hypothetical protein
MVFKGIEMGVKTDLKSPARSNKQCVGNPLAPAGPSFTHAPCGKPVGENLSFVRGKLTDFSRAH